MNRLALMTGILSLTLVGVAAQAQMQSSDSQPGSQPKIYQGQPQPESDTLPGITYSVTQPPATDSGSQPKLYQHQAQPGAQTPPGSTYAATQQRNQSQPGAQPKLYQEQAAPAPIADGATTTSAYGGDTGAQTSTGFFTGWFQRMDDESSSGHQAVQPGSQPKFHRETTTAQESHGPGITYPYDHPPVAQPAGTIPPGGTYAATQPPQTQPGSQPKLHQERVTEGPGAVVAPVAEPPPMQPAPLAVAPPPPAQPGQPQKLVATPALPDQPAAGAQASATDPAALNQISPAAGTPAGAPVNEPVAGGGDASGSRLMTEMEKCQQLTDMTGRADCEMQAHKKISQAVDFSPPSIQPDNQFERNNSGNGGGAE